MLGELNGRAVEEKGSRSFHSAQMAKYHRRNSLPQTCDLVSALRLWVICPNPLELLSAHPQTVGKGMSSTTGQL